ncbi:MAG: SLC13 family permease [candidate division KSB1 bacterium]|nr:SLC13 family permease [candidate division KSB1 bacterium]MDZ7364561.1 SLC13 family permease [candidate division KSB1 bacterium]MDZ7405736.1 SLC13 family permease [candidate division KSB1 bacterium]
MSFLFLILTGFLLSRLGVRYGLIEQFFARGLGRRHDSITNFLLALMATTAVISMFIPNFITALALLPILENLRKHFEQQYAPQLARRLTTAMVLAAIYGCNLGGMGSLIGSPANALMLGALELYQAPGREKINFLSWFGWSLPLTAILIGCAWVQLVYVILPRAVRRARVELAHSSSENRPQGIAGRAILAIGIWLAFWSAHSILQISLPAPEASLSLRGLKISWTHWDKIAAWFGMLYVLVLFTPLFTGSDRRREPILRFSDCFQQLPLRAFGVLLLALAIGGVLIALQAPQWAATQVSQMLPLQATPFSLYFFMCFTTTLATEFFHNTAVTVAFFPVMHALAERLLLSPLLALMAVGLAATNAFMLPISTPVNALLYGGVKHVSLKTMAASGLLLDFISALAMALFLAQVIPWYYGLP